MIRIEPHARERMKERGIARSEVEEAIQNGVAVPAKHGRTEFRHVIEEPGAYAGKPYLRKVLRIFAIEESGEWIVITAIADYQKR